MNAPEKEKNRANDPINRLFDLNIRKMFLWASAVFLPFCIFVWVTSGCLCVPVDDNFSLFLPTLLTFLISAAASGCSLYAILSIMLYRKAMPDRKRQFLRIRRYIRKAVLYLLIYAIPAGIFEGLTLLCGLDLFPLRGVAENLVLWRPEMAPLASLFDISQSALLCLIITLFASMVLGLVFSRFPCLKRLSLSLYALSFFSMGFMLLAMFTENHFPGVIKHEGRIISAVQDPAKFNAMVVGYVAGAGLFFSIGAAALVTALRPAKPPGKASKSGVNC